MKVKNSAHEVAKDLQMTMYIFQTVLAFFQLTYLYCITTAVRQRTRHLLWLDKLYCAVQVQREFRSTYKSNPRDDKCARRGIINLERLPAWRNVNL